MWVGHEVRCEIYGMRVHNKYALNVHLLAAHKDDPVRRKLIEEGARLWKCGMEGCRATYLKEARLEEERCTGMERSKMLGSGSQARFAEKHFGIGTRSRFTKHPTS